MARKKSDLWIFNYDFEYRLAKKGPIKIAGSQITPWYFLNRNSLILTPLLKSGDTMLVYEKPAAILLEQYLEYSVVPPELLEFIPESETNSVLEDFQPILDDSIKNHLLIFWGLAQQAFNFASFPLRFSLIEKLNSKLFTTNLRERFLPPSWQIPCLALTDKIITEHTLKTIVKKQIKKNGISLIKHAFGVSGRLIDETDGTSLSHHQLKRWQHWIKREGGILIEKKLQIEQEWSLQLQFIKGGKFEVLVLTRLFNTSDFAYRGTAISQADQTLIPTLLKQLNPLLNYISSLGYQGPLGLDIVETEDGTLQLLEINARYTMGRVAFAWQKRLGEYPHNYFTSFFYNGSSNLRRIVKSAQEISLNMGANLFIINQVSHPLEKRSFITLYVGSDSIQRNLKCVKNLGLH